MTRRPSLGLDLLEAREVPATLAELAAVARPPAGVTPPPGVTVRLVAPDRLVITGTAGDDVVAVTLRPGGAYRVTTAAGSAHVVAPQLAGGVIVFLGGNGNDRFTNDTAARSAADGGAGDDTLTGGRGADQLVGGDGADVLVGRAGNDRLDAGDGADRLDAGDGADYLLDGAGDDRADGGAGDDRFVSGGGADILVGGVGVDVFAGDLAADACYQAYLPPDAPFGAVVRPKV